MTKRTVKSAGDRERERAIGLAAKADKATQRRERRQRSDQLIAEHEGRQRIRFGTPKKPTTSKPRDKRRRAAQKRQQELNKTQRGN